MKNTLLIINFLLIMGCGQGPALPSPAEQANDFHACQNKLTEVIIYDIFSPPVASRIYAYANLAAYEAMRLSDAAMPPMAGKIRDFKPVPDPPDGEVNHTLAGLKAFLSVARALTFSTQYFDEFEKTLFEKYENALPGNVFKNSMMHGEAVGNHVIAFSKGDNYGKTRGLRYTLRKQPGTWEPTPPAYADAVEPNWGTIRPLVLDSAGQFTVPAMPVFSTVENSPFRREVAEALDMSRKLTDEQRRIAWFWDDNAFVVDVQGHTMTASKKLTPGGHWLMIAQRFCRTQNLSAAQSAQVCFFTSAALFDGFIACWKVKFDTHRIRPETVIQTDLDKNWQPYLQTPPFPEYPSGHSTISAASAEVLTAFFGDNVAFVDSTEHVFGHGIGQFASFRAAAAEASESRLLGGIHFRSGCEAGAGLGKQVGIEILKKLKI
jgi:hypothetical protein